MNDDMSMNDDMNMDDDMVGMDMDMDMSMCFGCGSYDQYPIYVVFKKWSINNDTAYVWSCIGIIALTILYRFLISLEADYSNWMLKKLQSSQTSSENISPSSPKMTDMIIDNANSKGGSGWLNKNSVPMNCNVFFMKIIGSFFQAALYAFSLFLMLIAMTYNYALVGSLILGYFLGDFLFGVNRSIVFQDGMFQVSFYTNYVEVGNIDCCN